MSEVRTGTVLRIAFVATIAVALLELGGGLLSGSLALLSDAAHVFMDAFALGIAVLANAGAALPATARQTFGFARLEVLAALANGGLLFAIAVLITIEAIHRFGASQVPQGLPMAAIAAVGLATNVAIGFALARVAHRNINVKAALFHVAGDAIAAAAVLAGGVIVAIRPVAWIDPAIALFIAGIIVVGVVHVIREATDVLLESAPSHAQVAEVRERIRRLSGVVDVHDLHVWTLGPGSHALSAHVLLNDARISEASALLRQIDGCVREEFGISHVTLQFECESCAEDERIVCTQIAKIPAG